MHPDELWDDDRIETPSVEDAEWAAELERRALEGDE